MKETKTPWSDSILMVCTACTKKTLGGVDLKLEGNAGENLKQYLKGLLIEKGLGKTVRVVTSSCLDVCEQGVQAVSHCKINGATKTLTIHPELDREALLEYLSKSI